jgi:tetratricopeptide (TPR) repeat protein
MEPIPAPAASAKQTDDRPSGFSLRHLWQVPVFFLGVAAVLTACLTRPFVGHDPIRQFHHDLAEARRLLHRQSSDPDEALRHAQKAVDGIMYDAGRAAEAFFLLGSAHIRVAETAGGTGADEHWREAKRYLEEAERRGLTGEDAGQVHYRLAKVGFHTKDDPQRVVELLKANTEQAEDRAEAYSLLSQAYLRLNPPNLKEALLANKVLREKVPQIGEDVLGPAKLSGAKLLLRLHQPEEARKTLEKIDDQAPAATLNEAHMLLAGLYQDERKWSAAAELWKAVLAEKRVSLPDPGIVLYNLGLCCRALDQSNKAAEAWSECLRRNHGEEGQAAALALAELRLQEANSEKAVEMLGEAVAKVRKAEDWKNSLADLPRVRQLFEKSVQTYRQANRFDLAVRAAELYERLAVPPKAQILRADLHTEWARHKLEQARQVKEAAVRNKEATAAHELYRQAAEARAEAARLIDAKADKDEHLWLSAAYSFEGRDYPRAREKLEKILQVDLENIDRMSEGWYFLGETYKNLQKKKEAETAYGRCIECDARFTCRARYQLALLDIEAGRIDQAASNLDQNLKLDHGEPDQEFQEKSRFALCSLLYQGGSKFPANYRRVVVLLEGVLDRASVTPEAVRARYQLADSYRQLGAQRTVNHFMSREMSRDAADHYLEENRRSLGHAAEEFTRLEEILKDQELASLLTVRQRNEVPFIVAGCNYDLGEYDKALQKYEELAVKWGKTLFGLRALAETVRCYGVVKNFDKMRERTEQIHSLLPTTEGLSEAEKQHWADWLNLASKIPLPLKDPERGRGQDRQLNDSRNPIPSAERSLPPTSPER